VRSRAHCIAPVCIERIAPRIRLRFFREFPAGTKFPGQAMTGADIITPKRDLPVWPIRYFFRARRARSSDESMSFCTSAATSGSARLIGFKGSDTM
jgi:hypothetical protein